jgi:hypothetical protein
VRETQGDLSGALAAYRDGLAIFRALVQKDPGNAEWQEDLSVSDEKIGDVLVAQDNLAGALASYRDDLAIRKALVLKDPSNVPWQTELVISLVKVASAGDDPVQNYAAALAIAKRLEAAGQLNAPQKGWVADLEARLAKAKAGK